MNEFSLVGKDARGITEAELAAAVEQSIADCRDKLKKVLLVVPDHTRYYSNAGRIANLYWHLLEDVAQVDVLEALGTHAPMTEAECRAMYGDIPHSRFIEHNWRTDVVKLGQVPAAFVAEVSEGVVGAPIDVEVSRHVMQGGYDLILSIGQVVPHEVVGMANQSKNLFVGCGGASMINASHMLGAYYGMERMMGRDGTPVRKVFDYAQERFLAGLPLCYVLTVTNRGPGGVIYTHGLHIGKARKWFEAAVAQAQEKNLTFVDAPLKKVVVYLDGGEFKSTWLGNKAVYRTRMAIADGGELLVLAPGVERFGEDAEIDRLIRKYGYRGRENIIRLAAENEDLQNNMGAAAHLIHGSSDGRFSVTYCTRRLTQGEVEGVGFGWMDYGEAVAKYDPRHLADGPNTLPDGEEIYYIPNPALGLWADKSKF